MKSGGPSRSVPLLAKGLSAEGVDITLMTFRSENMNIHATAGTDVKIKVLESDYKLSEIEDFIVREQFNLIQLQSIWDWSYHKIAKIAQKHHIPYIITPRGMLEPWSLSQKTLKKRIALLLYLKHDLDKVACIYTTAEMEAENVKRLGIKTPCSVIPNGIDIADYTCRTNKDKVKKQILFLSRIHEKKGIELLIDAWQNIHTDYPDWSVKIVGNGEESYIERLKTKVSRAGLESSIDILPPVFGKDKVGLYHSSALFVLPSYSENFGMVIAEALSCGVPVITTEFTPWGFLNEEKIGWSIKLSVEDLIIAIREAIKLYPDQLYEMGQKGRTFVVERFDYRSIAIKTLKLYEWILHDGGKPEFVKL